jgi:hypothetical protein
MSFFSSTHPTTSTRRTDVTPSQTQRIIIPHTNDIRARTDGIEQIEKAE